MSLVVTENCPVSTMLIWQKRLLPFPFKTSAKSLVSVRSATLLESTQSSRRSNPWLARVFKPFGMKLFISWIVGRNNLWTSQAQEHLYSPALPLKLHLHGMKSDGIPELWIRTRVTFSYSRSQGSVMLFEQSRTCILKPSTTCETSLNNLALDQELSVDMNHCQSSMKI